MRAILAWTAAVGNHQRKGLKTFPRAAELPHATLRAGYLSEIQGEGLGVPLSVPTR